MFRDEYEFRSVFSEFDVFGGEYDVVVGVDEVGGSSCEDADNCQKRSIRDLQLSVLIQ